VDLVIWNEDHAGYRQLLQEQILGLIAAGLEARFTDRPGGIFPRLASRYRARPGAVPNGLPRHPHGQPGYALGPDPPSRVAEVPVPLLRPAGSVATKPRRRPGKSRATDLLHGLGGFTPDGREYVITTTHGKRHRHRG